MGSTLGPRRWSGLFWPVCVGLLSILGVMLYWLIPAWPVRDIPLDLHEALSRIVYISDDGRFVKTGPLVNWDLDGRPFGVGIGQAETDRVGSPIAAWDIANNESRPNLAGRTSFAEQSRLFVRSQTLVYLFDRLQPNNRIELVYLPTGERKMVEKIRQVLTGGSSRGKWMVLLIDEGDHTKLRFLNLQSWEIHDLPNGPKFRVEESPYAVVSEDESRLVILSFGVDDRKEIQIWDFGTKQLLKTHKAPDFVTIEQLSTTGDRLMLESPAAEEFFILSVLDVNTGDIRQITKQDYGKRVCTWVWSTDGRRLAHFSRIAGIVSLRQNSKDAISGDDEFLRIWDTDTPKLLYKSDSPAQISELWFRGNPDLLLALWWDDNDNRLIAWDAKTGQVLWTAHTSARFVVECGDRAPLLISSDGRIDEVDLTNGLLRTIQISQIPREKVLLGIDLSWMHVVDPDPVNGFAKRQDLVSPDGTRILSGSRVGSADTFLGRVLGWIWPNSSGEKYRTWNVYDVATGANLLRFSLSEKDKLGNASFSKDGSTMALAMDRGPSASQLTVWDLTRTRERWISTGVPLTLLAMIALWRRWRIRRLRGGQDHAGVAAAEAEGVGGGRADAVGDGVVGDVK